jgi:hypothetical protein
MPRLGGDLGDLDPAGAVGGSPITVAAALAVPVRLEARRSALAATSPRQQVMGGTHQVTGTAQPPPFPRDA